MKELGVLLLVTIVAMGILLIILLHKITLLKKQTDDIVKEVKAYVAYVTDEMEETEEVENQTSGVQKKVSLIKEKSCKPASREEAENHIIQAVLGEYFL